MNASERFSALFTGKEKPDRLPVIEWAPWWNLTVDNWLKEGLPPEKAGYEELQRYFGLDICLQGCVGEKTAATPQPKSFGSGIIEDEKGYEAILPTLYPDAEAVLPDRIFRDAEITRERGDTVRFFTVNGFFWFARDLLGIERHLYAFYDCPELLHRMAKDYCQWLKKVFLRISDGFRYDFMSFAEDMSYNNGPMLSKECFDEFLAPYYREVIPYMKRAGIPVFIDSDGDITKAVDWYAEVGADGMFPLEKQAGADVACYIKKQPHMVFLGHFDKMCMKRGEGAMRAEFERLLPSMRTLKLIPSVDHQTPPDVSIENYRIYVRLLKEYAEKAVQADD